MELKPWESEATVPAPFCPLYNLPGGHDAEVPRSVHLETKGNNDIGTRFSKVTHTRQRTELLRVSLFTHCIYTLAT
jgi:hypothetical protein